MGKHALKGVVEGDFYSQTDNADNISPRLRLTNVAYTHDRTSLTVGMDWTPVMALHPDLIDFSIMGYGGNLWQRLPQITVRHSSYTQRQPFNGHGAGAFGGACSGAPSNFTCLENVFNDSGKMPYVGTRLGYTGAGALQGVSAALNGAYRYYRSAPVGAGVTGLNGTPLLSSGNNINSYLIGGELVVPITRRLKFSGEVAYGQALDVEFFRFAQSLNLANGKPIRTTVGWHS